MNLSIKNTLTIAACVAASTTSATAESSSASASHCDALSNSIVNGCGITCHSHKRPDSVAPIGVMASHTHKKGEWMASYRYMFMSMQQNFDGDSHVSDASVLADPRFMIVPTDMDMEMHMLGIMYAPTDNFTLMGMFNYSLTSMNHRTMMGGTFRTQASGWGDSSLTALYKFHDNGNQRAHVGFGLQLPTGDTGASDFLPPAGGVRRLPYAMQTGTGTFALLPSITYTSHYSDWSWGAQARGKIYLGDNSEGYSPGHRAEATAWIAKPLTEWASVSFRLKGETWGNIDGRDRFLMPAPVPTTNTSLRGGSRIDASVGLNLLETQSGIRFGIELSKTIYQKLDGPQLGNDWGLTLGVQYAW